MTVARAQVLERPRHLVGQHLPLPAPAEDTGLLRVEACGLCGTDHEQWSGVLNPGFPFVPGHESVGVIEAIGPVAARRWGVDVGDRVAVEVFQSCGACAPCRAGVERRCARHGLADMYGFISVERPPGLWGGYATHQHLAPDSRVVRVPAALDPVVATLFNPLGAGVRWGVTVPEVGPGAVVAVLGPGVRGLSACAAAKEAGAAFVMLTGVSPHDDARLALGPAFGADLTVDVRAADPARQLRAATGAGADVVVDVTAKAPEALGQAVAIARDGGAIVMAGTRGVADTPGFWPDLVVYKELRILGALGVDTASYVAALDLLASGRYPFADLPREQVGLDGVGGLLARLAGEAPGPVPVHGVVTP